MDVARQVFVLLSVLVACWGFERCEAAGKFSLEVHHMFSDTVKQALGFGVLLPEKGSLDYFKLLAHRDRFIRGRDLASNNEETPLTLMQGNLTISISFLRFLHYATVSVGTPPTLFLVSLDTSRNYFWLPCNCGTSCIRDLKDVGSSKSVPLNIYSPSASSTSSSISCDDKRCFGSRKCAPTSMCQYQVGFGSSLVSTGTVLQDVLHLVTEDKDLNPVQAMITLGCGQNQTSVSEGNMAVNGCLGLGLRDYSVPSLLAKANIAANSFSMCFGSGENVGRISFGDKGYSDQKETPLSAYESNVAYVLNVTGVSVGGDPVNVPFYALIDTGSSFTLLREPAYGVFTKAFDDLMENKRRPDDPENPFEFCYDSSPNVTTLVEIIFLGGSKMTLKNPFFSARTKEDTRIYCLGILKAVNFNTIGHNFFSGHRIVFDRERMVFGWKPSNCFDDESLSSQSSSPPGNKAPPTPAGPARTPPIDNHNPTRNSGTGGANFSPLVAFLLFLPLLAFF